MVRTLFLAVLMASLATVPVLSQQPEEPEPTPTEEGQEPEQGERGRGRGGNNDDDEGIKPYEEVITDEAETEEGVFKVHRIDDDVYYEIPTSELGNEFLMVTRISKTQLGQGFGGQKLGTRVVRWVRRGDRIFLRNVNHDVIADEGLPIAQAVADSNTEAIISAFNIAALGEDDAPVIEVTSLYATEITEFSARSRLQARGFDRQRSYVDRVMAFPTNIEIRAVHTYTRPPDNTPATRGGRGRGRGNRGMAPGSATLEIAFSMIKLPEDPMMPRLFDDRVGYFSDSYIDYGRDEHRSETRRFITRWRLDKQDPSAEISGPVKPIIYYVDPATPAKWVPWVIKGVEDWQPAFEAAGFSQRDHLTGGARRSELES